VPQLLVLCSTGAGELGAIPAGAATPAARRGPQEYGRALE
jgi:hypothetical protein